jgi:hypothetical protein
LVPSYHDSDPSTVSVELRDDVGLVSVEALDERVVGKEKVVVAIVDLRSAKLGNTAQSSRLETRPVYWGFGQ